MTDEPLLKALLAIRALGSAAIIEADRPNPYLLAVLADIVRDADRAIGYYHEAAPGFPPGGLTGC